MIILSYWKIGNVYGKQIVVDFDLREYSCLVEVDSYVSIQRAHVDVRTQDLHSFNDVGNDGGNSNTRAKCDEIKHALFIKGSIATEKQRRGFFLVKNDTARKTAQALCFGQLHGVALTSF